MSLKILIADDHFPVRIGLNILVNETISPEPMIEFASNGLEVLTQLEKQKFDLLITDINMPSTDGFDLIKTIIKTYPSTKVLIVSVNPSDVFAQRFKDIGASGYVSKSESDDVLKSTILQIVSGTEVFETNILDSTIEEEGNPFNLLSAREFEVMILLLKGLGNLEICNKMNITKTTASTYKVRIFSKLNISNIMELNHLARKYHIVDDDLLLY